MCLRRRDHHRHPAWTRIRTFRLCVYGLDKPRLVCRARWSVRRHGCAAPASLQIAARYRVLQTDLPDPDIQAGVPLGILCRTASRISAGTRRWHAASTGGTGLPMAAMLRCMRSTTACHSAALCCAGSWRAGHWEQVALKAWPAGVSRPLAVAVFKGIWACFCKYASSIEPCPCGRLHMRRGTRAGAAGTGSAAAGLRCRGCGGVCRRRGCARCARG